MLMLGNNITASGDIMKKIQWAEAIAMIRNQNSQLASKVRQLRNILELDANSYKRMKTFLPYFTCGIFNPPYRKSENFGYIESFILDIDHIKEKGKDLLQIKSLMQKDSRVGACFISPSNDGLKVVCNLSEKCYDKGKFSAFYKIFAFRFSKHYNLEQVIDIKTSDVTRACFLSSDETAFFNPDAEAVFMNDYVDFEAQSEIKETLKIIQKEDEFQIIPAPKENLATDVLAHIKATLSNKPVKEREKIVFVPDELNKVIQSLLDLLEDSQIKVKAVESIHYGKKITVEIFPLWAEVNVFYGKKGFSVVKTPKSGSNAELCDVTYSIIAAYIYQLNRNG